ncbi:unnamed protein product [Prunus armeniaca]
MDGGGDGATIGKVRLEPVKTAGYSRVFRRRKLLDLDRDVETRLLGPVSRAEVAGCGGNVVVSGSGEQWLGGGGGGVVYAKGGGLGRESESVGSQGVTMEVDKGWCGSRKRRPEPRNVLKRATLYTTHPKNRSQLHNEFSGAAKRLKESNFVRDSSQESFTASQRIFRVSEQHRKVFVFGSFLSARKNLDRGDSGAVFPRDVVAFSELLAQIGQSRETS